MEKFDSSMVNVGDRVVVRTWGWRGENVFIEKVEKKTPSGLIDVNGQRWKKDGSPYGDHKGCLELLTPELEKQIEEERHRKLIVNNVSAIGWKYVSTETIEKIIEMVEEDVKNNE